MSAILVVEDEPAVAELLQMNLRHAGHAVRVAADGLAAQAAIDVELPDLVLLDWMLPGASGPDLARRWRAQARTRELPIIMLTARAAEADLIAGLDAGADDYLTKPFSPQALLARMRALLRRKAPHALDDLVRWSNWTLNPHTRTLVCDGASSPPAQLGPSEFRLLHFLMTHAERVHSRAHLLDQVWGDHVFIEERTVDVHIKRLRHAVQATGMAERLQTVRGAGYRLTTDSACSAG